MVDDPVVEGRGPPASMAACLNDTGYLLHAFDPGADTATFLPIDEARLRQAAFIDGRTSLSDEQPVTVSGLKAASAAVEAGAAEPRYIFHGAFCGSTLLARLLDEPDRTLVLREPQVLGELADRKLDAGLTRADLAGLCALATATLFRPRRSGEPVVVKPSNWVNNLLPELRDVAVSPRAVFIESRLQDFLEAVFRGGTERMKFVTEAAWRLSRGSPADAALLERAVREAHTGAGRAAHLAIVLHVLQRRRFEVAREHPGWVHTAVIRRELLASDPLQAAKVASDALGLELADESLEVSARRWTARHAKDAEVAYTPQAQAAADRSVMMQFGDDLRTALAWAEKAGLKLE